MLRNPLMRARSVRGRPLRVALTGSGLAGLATVIVLACSPQAQRAGGLELIIVADKSLLVRPASRRDHGMMFPSPW